MGNASFKRLARRIRARPGESELPARGVRIEAARRISGLDCEYGDIIELPVTISNNSELTLDSAKTPGPDLISYHWLSPEGEFLVAEGLRTRLPHPLSPGDSIVVRPRVSVTTSAPEAVVVVDIVREGEFWLGAKGGEPLRLPCHINSDWISRKHRFAAPPAGGGPPGTGLPSIEELWGERAEVRHEKHLMGWLDHQTVLQECVIPAVGSAEDNWLVALMRNHGVPSGGHWLSIGCGDGDFEMWLLDGDRAGTIEGVDISPGAVELANRTARERGLESRASFRVLDINREEIPPGSYDVIIASMAIHHVEDLEGALEKICRGLHPGGFFLANEYVGPNRFNFPERQRRIVDDLIALLPKGLRINTVASKTEGMVVFKDHYEWRSAEQWEQTDASEAVRSQDIIDALRGTFAEHRVYEYGGTLLHPVLEHIIANFDPDEERDRAILRTLYLFESKLIESGSLQNDFAILVGRRSGESLPADGENSIL